MNPKSYLLDIEGTTTPIEFVTRTLFPYARARLEEFVSNHLTPDDEVQLRSEWEGTWPGALAVLHEFMDLDVKSTGLKSIQGRIWADGYKNGDLRGEMYPDVLPALQRWTSRGAQVFIFSSGSVLAQKLIFSQTNVGELSNYIAGYFDTTTGLKRDPKSYRLIAETCEILPAEMHFLSDIGQEVEAAHGAGLRASLIDRNHGDTFDGYD